jgi:hypothetical protein
MAKQEQEKAIIAIVNNRFVKSEGGDYEEVVEVLKFDTAPAIVKRGYGLTLNLGNYESARIDVAIEVPCYVQDVEKADRWARAWVEERVVAEVNSVRGKDEDDDDRAPSF